MEKRRYTTLVYKAIKKNGMVSFRIFFKESSRMSKVSHMIFISVENRISESKKLLTLKFALNGVQLWIWSDFYDPSSNTKAILQKYYVPNLV